MSEKPLPFDHVVTFPRNGSYTMWRRFETNCRGVSSYLLEIAKTIKHRRVPISHRAWALRTAKLARLDVALVEASGQAQLPLCTTAEATAVHSSLQHHD
jgi:hypothetical protein